MAYNSTKSGAELDAAIEGVATVVNHVAPLSWDHIRFLSADPFPLPARGCWFRTTTGEMVYTIDGVNVRAVTAPTEEAPEEETLGALAAFPYAEGFGAVTVGGRGGQIIKVTNLNASGAGSLREALTTAGPRIVVFEVSGTINLVGQNVLYVTQPYLTVAGQTAPYPGIQILGSGIRIKTHDVIIQHLAVRIGDTNTTNPAPDARDGIAIRDGYNIVIDHVSSSWSIDENIDTGNEPVSPQYITISNSMFTEGLYATGIRSDGESHSCAIKIDPDTKYLTIIKNLLAHNHSRNPLQQGGITSAIINNLVYNVGPYEFMPVSMGYDSPTNSPSIHSFVGNVMIKGPNTTANNGIAIAGTFVAGSEVYGSDNLLLSTTRTPLANAYVVGGAVSAASVGTSPIDLSGLTIFDSADLEAHLAANVGTRPGERNATDTRIISEVAAGTGSIKNHISEVTVDTFANNTRSLTGLLPASPNAEYNVDGWTNMDVWMYQMAKLVEGRE